MTSHHVVICIFFVLFDAVHVFLCCLDVAGITVPHAPESTEQCSRRSFWDSGSLDNFGLRTYQKIMRGINKASQYVSRVTMGEAW